MRTNGIVKYYTFLVSLSFTQDKGGNGADVATSCPEYFIDEQINTITCTVNQTSITNANCGLPPSSVLLQLISALGSQLDKCSSTYPAISCAQQTTPRACFCADQNGDVFTYQWNFVANKTQQGGNFSCNICDFYTGKDPERVISPNCSRIKFATPTTTASSSITTAVTTTVTKSTASEVTTLNDSTTTKENSTQVNSTCHDDIMCEKWKIALIVALPILFIIAVIIGILCCKWKELLCFGNKTVDQTHSSNEHHQNDLRSGRQNASLVSGPPPKNGALQNSENPDASSASASPDQSSLKKSKPTNSEKTGSQHIASEKSPPKEHSTRKETSLDLTELNSGSATSEESASNIVTHRQLRPLPVPNLTSVERNSSLDPFRQTNPLPEISARLKQ